jgi:membrane associated rhomboid family serine protease
MKISAVKLLIAANVLVFLVQSQTRVDLTALELWPLQPIGGQAQHFQPWQLVTYAFLHSTDYLTHLGFNMLGLWMFGSEVERRVGPGRLLACYFASVITAALSQLFVPVMFGAPPAPVIGASGGVFGLILAYAILFPRQKVIPLIPPIPMPAWVFATLYAVLELILGITGRVADVAHVAHLGGMVGSALVMTQWRFSQAAR